MKKYFFLFFLYPILTFSQQSKIDSLLTLLKTDKEDTIQVNHLNDLCWEYRNIGAYDSSHYFGNAALVLGKRISFSKGIAASYNNIGVIYEDQGKYDNALENYFSSLKIREKIGNKEGMSDCYNNIGGIYADQANYHKAIENYFASLNLSKEINNKQGISGCYNNIGIIYYKQGNYTVALETFLFALKINEEMGNKNWMAINYNNIGNIYADQANYQRALENYFASLKIREKIGDKQGAASSYGNIGTVYLEQNEIDEAKKQLFMSLSIAMEIGAKNDVKYAYKILSCCDSVIGNWKGAYKYYQLYSQMKDSLLNEENGKQIAEMQTKYESEKKEAQIKQMEKDKEKQTAIAAAESKRKNLFLLLVTVIAVAVAVIAVVIFRSLHITRKQKHIITLQKDEVTKQREEIAHKNKDLTDSINYAQRIQSSILTSEQYLNDMFLPQGQVSSHFILYKPKDIVAGDFYWAYKTLEGKAIWVAADCTGHGVPGAFMSMIGNSLLNEIVMEKGIHEPDEILNNMRAGVIKALGQSGGDKKKDGMDAALCCWDKANNKISFSGANNSLWIFRKEEFIEIAPDSQPVGQHLVMNPFTKREFQLQQGDTLYTFTDGYCDQFGGQKGKKFKYKPFRELLISIQDKSMPEQKQILNKTIDDWRGELEQIDDICVFGVRV